ncbi:MAG: sulfite exporter TauE/SafE family protein [Ghiorsea sp.]
MELTWILPYLVLGLAVGFFAGLLGIGGGGIMVPILTMLFVAQGFEGEQLVHMALGTSLASIVVTSLSSMYSHHKHGAVIWPVVRKMAPGILIGTFTLSYLASHFSSLFMALFFSAFMTYISVQMFLNIKPKPSRKLPENLGLTLTGFGIGGFSGLVAIGGGSLTVPFLTWCNVKIQHAIGTSSALGFPIAVAGSLGYMVSGWGQEGLPEHSLGFVYLPAVVLISLVSVFTAPLGAKLAHRLPVGLLKKIFGLILLALAIKMLQVVI